ncbi:poly [ADP-ribose] polymerase [Fopius arisanus]|uniref:Poly [ADP-ribose] polymerase n=2 Tax=Fopius arisanus TaxID=64838 RepID=A0A0C9REF5_9HYME|nr:PREDICTED: poly [ADP-ribose] polymerase [Fopius arisanus]
MADRLPFLVEYAKSGRAACKACKAPIIKESLRIAKIVQSPFHDGTLPHWYHEQCFWSKAKVKTVGDIGNLENLLWEDQEKIRSKIDSTDATDTVDPTDSSGGKQSRKRPSAKLHTDFSVEYAKSNRSTCVGCEAPILKGSIRISKKDFESEKGQLLGGVPRWHHLDCFLNLRSSLEFYDSGDAIPGFESLSKEDKKTLKSKIPKMKAADIPPPPKKIKGEPIDVEENEQMKKQNEEIFQLRQKLQTLKRNEQIKLLEHNSQYVSSDKGQLLNNLADRMIFGAVKPCKKCSGACNFVSGVGYKCKGDLTEWTKCEEVTQDPERVKFKIPDDIRESIPFLLEFKPKVERRILRITGPSTSSEVKKEETSGPLVNRGPLPLKGMEFFIAGKGTKTKEDLRKEIMVLGGQVVSRVHENLAAVIADKKAFTKGGKAFDNAESFRIQVVTEDFVDEAKDYTTAPISLITQKNIASWGDDPRTRIAVTMEKSSSKGKSVYEKKSSGKVKLTMKGAGVVDPASGLQDVAGIYQSGKDKYSVTLGLTDIQSMKNSYYKLQLLKHDKKKKYWLFRSWGRIGTTIGGEKCESMALEDALDMFNQLYLDKSGNEWTARDYFVKVPGKMYPIDVDEGDDSSTTESLESDIKSKLKKPVQDLIKLIFDVNLMKEVMKEYELDTEKMPLGKLSKKQLQMAYGVLKEVQVLLASGDPNRLKLIDASNRFYTLVPHSFGIKQPTILDNEALIKAKCEMLDSLMEMEIAYNLLNIKSETGQSPLDAHYEQLNTDIDVLDRESKEFKIIQEYTKNTHADTHSHYQLEIEDVFVIKRQGEEKRFKPFKKLPNRKLLWHGSRTTNFAGILCQGLRIAPPEAPVTGYMFGKGIYFADMVSKSANYCCTSSKSPTGLLMLCEVALGNMDERYAAYYVERLPKGKHSTFGRGQTTPDPSKSGVIDDGIEVPYGRGIRANLPTNSSLLYNEYIVYDVAQVKAKYLVRMKFKYST